MWYLFKHSYLYTDLTFLKMKNIVKIRSRRTCFGISLEYTNSLAKNLSEFITLIITRGWSTEVGPAPHGIAACTFPQAREGGFCFLTFPCHTVNLWKWSTRTLFFPVTYIEINAYLKWLKKDNAPIRTLFSPAHQHYGITEFRKSIQLHYTDRFLITK